jgi:hypothetical protein
MGSLDPYPDPDSQSRAGFKREKMTRKNEKKVNKISFFAVLDVLF